MIAEVGHYALVLALGLALIQAVVPHLEKRGGGAIVLIGSQSSMLPLTSQVAYAASKGALHSAMLYFAKELGPRNIRVFAVSPGPLRTRASSGIAHFDELIDMAVKRSPGQRLVDIAEIGRVVAFLAMPASSAMTGDVVYIDAGLHNMA